MKIAVLNDTFSREGGTESYIAAVIDGLRKKGHEVFLVIGDSQGTLPTGAVLIPRLDRQAVYRFFSDQKIQISYLQTVENLDIYNYLLPLMPTFRLLHDTASVCKYHFHKNEVCSEKLSLWHCFRSAYLEESMTKNPFKIIELVARRQAVLQRLNALEKIFVNSQFTRRSYVQEGVAENLIEVLPLFPTVTPDQGVIIKKKDNVIVFSGRMFREKGVEYLIRAFSLVRESARLWIVGDGWELQRSKQLVEDLSLNKWVEFFGFVSQEELKKIYSQASVGVVPSIWGEPFGLSGIEMMSFGVPVVGFNSGGIAEWLKSNYNGFLVDRADWHELAEKINILILDKEKRETLGRNAQKFVLENYNINSHLISLESHFQTALAKQPLNNK